MEHTKFRIEIETVNKNIFTKTLISDSEDIRIYVARTSTNSANVPLEQCWKILYNDLYRLGLFSQERPLSFTFNGRQKFFNPANVVNFSLIKEE